MGEKDFFCYLNSKKFANRDHNRDLKKQKLPTKTKYRLD